MARSRAGLLFTTIVVGYLWASSWLPTYSSAPARSSGVCTIQVRGLLGKTIHGIIINGKCVPIGSTGGGPHNPTRTASCGVYHPGGTWNAASCGPTPLLCYTVDKKTHKRIQVQAFATQTLRNGHWSTPAAWCPNDGKPTVTAAAIRERALQLLPHVAIGSAWTTTALVNAQTVLWADTGAARTLPTVTIVGTRVALRIHFARATWHFGDGETDGPTTPGKPYDEANDPCRTAQCPDYYGHTYRVTGAMTITMSVAWQVQYRIAGGDWTPLDAPLTGPQAEHALRVVEARGQLVPH